SCQQFRFVRARHELDRLSFTRRRLVIFRSEQHLPALGIGVEHGDAHDLSREWPEIKLAQQFVAARGAGGLVGNALGVAEEIFLLNLIELLQRQRRSFYVKNQFGHARGLDRFEELDWRTSLIRKADRSIPPVCRKKQRRLANLFFLPW